MTRVASGEQKVPENQTSFRWLNDWLAAVYAVQGIFILLLSVTKLLPVEISYVTNDPIATELADHPFLAGALRA